MKDLKNNITKGVDDWKWSQLLLLHDRADNTQARAVHRTDRVGHLKTNCAYSTVASTFSASLGQLV